MQEDPGQGGLTAAVADARSDHPHHVLASGCGNTISDGWIAAAVLARQERLVTLDRDFFSLLPPRQLTLLRG